jgi:hypothetical protein
MFNRCKIAARSSLLNRLALPQCVAPPRLGSSSRVRVWSMAYIEAVYKRLEMGFLIPRGEAAPRPWPLALPEPNAADRSGAGQHGPPSSMSRLIVKNSSDASDWVSWADCDCFGCWGRSGSGEIFACADFTVDVLADGGSSCEVNLLAGGSIFWKGNDDQTWVAMPT